MRTRFSEESLKYTIAYTKPRSVITTERGLYLCSLIKDLFQKDLNEQIEYKEYYKKQHLKHSAAALGIFVVPKLLYLIGYVPLRWLFLLIL